MVKKININKILSKNKVLYKKLYICNKNIKEYKKEIIFLNDKYEKIKKSYNYNFFEEMKEYNNLYNEIYNNNKNL